MRVKTLVTKAMGRRTQSRFALRPMAENHVPQRDLDSPAIREGRTVFPTRLRIPGQSAVLKSGFNQAKIGAKFHKGKWRGMRIFSVSLEERATCPTTCGLYRGCYGNGMPFAIRFKHGPALEQQIAVEVAELARKYPRGFVVRLHTLGDFYSVGYVRFWERLLDQWPMLRIFGYSARWDKGDPIADELLGLIARRWDRFAVRLSGAPIEVRSTITVDHRRDVPADAILCPAQIGKTESCSTCALCFQTERRIAFVRH